MTTDNDTTSSKEIQKETTLRPRSKKSRKRISSKVDSLEVKKRLSNMPDVYRGIYKKAMTGKSFRFAIHAQCLECVQWQRIEVAKCTDLGCPLYPYRPYQEVTEE